MDVKKDIRFRVYLSFTGIVVLAVAIIVKIVTGTGRKSTY
jgi:hypothetical protein